MDVVAHEAISHRFKSVLGRVFQQELKIMLPVVIFEKDILPAIAPLGDVMRNPRNHHPRNSRHAVNLREKWRSVNYK
jgi:hypothetical protein